MSPTVSHQCLFRASASIAGGMLEILGLGIAMVMDEGTSSYYLEATVPLKSKNPLLTAVLMKYDAENNL